MTARVVGLLLACALGSSASRAIDADFVIDQHNWVVEALADTPAPVMNRGLTMADLAAFDALDAITPRYHAYRMSLRAQPAALAESALLTAHQLVLAAQGELDAARIKRHYDEALGRIADSAAKRSGVTLGRRAAIALLAERADDDFFERVEPVKAAPGPGIYELTLA